MTREGGGRRGLARAFVASWAVVCWLVGCSAPSPPIHRGSAPAGASASADAVRSAPAPEPAHPEPPAVQVRRALPAKGSVECEGSDGTTDGVFTDTCPTATEVCCEHPRGEAKCQASGDDCPSGWERRRGCDGSDDCPAGKTCQTVVTETGGREEHVCTSAPPGSEVCHPSGACHTGREVCTRGRTCTGRGSRCVEGVTGKTFLCLPERPPLRCGDQVCSSAEAPVCVMATGKPPRCGGYRDAPDDLECFRDADCEQGAVCCVASAQRTLCLASCNLLALGHTAVCKTDADCARFFQKHRKQHEASGIRAMVCETNSWRGLGNCAAR